MGIKFPANWYICLTEVNHSDLLLTVCYFNKASFVLLVNQNLNLVNLDLHTSSKTVLKLFQIIQASHLTVERSESPAVLWHYSHLTKQRKTQLLSPQALFQGLSSFLTPSKQLVANVRTHNSRKQPNTERNL